MKESVLSLKEKTTQHFGFVTERCRRWRSTVCAHQVNKRVAYINYILPNE